MRRFAANAESSQIDACRNAAAQLVRSRPEQLHAPGGEKAIACKNLAIYGSSDAVSELAKLLPDPQLSSWARIALEAIPGQAADEALRMASNSLEGRLLVGTINSIGLFIQ